MDNLFKFGLFLLLSAAIVGGVMRFEKLTAENAQLTLKLDAAMEVLDRVEKHSANVAAVTVQLEKADEVRQVQLRTFERNLGKIAASNTEARAILAAIIPDDLLSGLRSYNATHSSNRTVKNSRASDRKP